MIKKAASIKYSDILHGDIFDFERVISEDDIDNFAKLTGDYNPLHVDKDFGSKSIFGKNVVHGMLAGSLFSTLVGMYCPGEKNLYLSQTLQFKNPIFAGELVRVVGTILEKNDSIKLITIKTDIIRGEDVLVTGKAIVKVLD